MEHEGVDGRGHGGDETPHTISAFQELLGDRYSIEREIGRGGMAIVYLAEDRKHRRPRLVHHSAQCSLMKFTN